jgi:flagellar motor switch protein FliG
MKNHGRPARGIAAYQRALGQKDERRGPAGPQPASEGETPPEEGLLKAGPAAEGLLKGREPIPRRIPAAPPAADSKYRRVAQFLILIGSDEAARIISTLEPEQVERVSAEIAAIRGISPEEAELVYGEFRSLLNASPGYSGATAGGPEAARRLLYAAFGPEKGESILVRALPGARKNPFDFLEDFSGEQIALLLREESPAAAALVLSRLSPELSAGSLAKFPPERKLELVRRIARLERSSPEVLDRVAAALREKARHIADAAGQAVSPVDGRNALAAILRHADYSFGGRILEELEDGDPDLSRDIKERLQTLEDVVKAEDRPLQDKLRTMADRDLALLLKGRSPEFTEKLLSNLSSSRRARLREEADLMGAVPKREADAAVRDFMAWFALSREEGRILLIDDEDVIL